MIVKDLIAALEQMPPSCEVLYVYDGAGRGRTDRVWQSRRGPVMISHLDETVYETEDRPKGAPTAREDPYWSVA